MLSIRDFLTQCRFSKIPEPYNCDKNIYPDYFTAKKMEVTLNEGEFLFIPAGWFHFIISESENNDIKLNTSISYFIKYDGCAKCDISFDKNTKYVDKISEISYSDVNLEYYKENSIPFIVRDYFIFNKLWECFNWTIDKLKNIFKNKTIIVTRSDSPCFASNFLSYFKPEQCAEFKTSFDIFLDAKNDNKHKYYIIQGMDEFELLDIEVPSFLGKNNEQKSAIWMNHGITPMSTENRNINNNKIFSSLHYDMYNNIIMQLFGQKKILLFPPSERDKLYMYNPYDPKFICYLSKQLK